MKLVLRSVACLAVLCLTGGIARAADGVQITQRTTVNGTATTGQVQITKDKMRAEMVNPVGGGTQIVIFDGAKGTMDIVDMGRKTYIEVTKAQLEQMVTMAQGMMQQMQQMMANMPPEQRAQMEGMMRGRGMGDPMAAMSMMTSSEPVEYRKTGTDRVGQWACDKYEGWKGGQKVSDMCNVAPSVLGLTAADLAVMQQLADTFKKIAPQGTGMLEPSREGIPVRSTTTIGGMTTTSELTGVSRQDVPDSAFQVPAGFTKQDLPAMGGMGMGRGRM